MEQYFRAEIPARWDVFQHGHNLKLISTPTPCEFYWDTIPSFRYFHKATYRTNYTRLIGTLCSAVSDAVLYVNTVCVHQQSNIKLDQRVKKKAGLLSVLWELLQACWKIIMKLVDRIPRVSIALKCTFRAPGPVLSSRYCPVLSYLIGTPTHSCRSPVSPTRGSSTMQTILQIQVETCS